MDVHSWTTKYEPQSIKEMVGNVNVLKDAMRYLKKYKCTKGAKNTKSGKGNEFSKGIIITGPSGVGKTLLAKLLALYRGYIPLEYNTSDLRRKNEISDMVDVYRSDIRKNFKANAKILLQAKKNLDACGLSKHQVGKAIIIDELDAMTKGQKSLKTVLTQLLHESSKHTPNRIIILTCGDDGVQSFKTIVNNCYWIKLKKVSDSEMTKLVEKVCEGEEVELKKSEKQSLAKFANGDCRRLLNSMEICFTNGNGLSNMSSAKISEIVQKFVQGDEETLKRLKLSSLSTEKVLENIVRQISVDEEKAIDQVNYVCGDSRILAKQLFQTYPTMIRQDISMEDQLKYVSECSDFMSFGDVYIGSDTFEGDHFMDMEKYTIYSVLGPLAKLKGGVANNFKMKVKGYAKMDGEDRSKQAQFDLRRKLTTMSVYFKNKTFDELAYVASCIAQKLKDGEYEEVSNFMYQFGMDPSVLDELIKIKVLKCPHGDDEIERYEPPLLSDIWKATAKRKLKKQFITDEEHHPVQGLKFKDEKSKRRKINFFEKYE